MTCDVLPNDALARGLDQILPAKHGDLRLAGIVTLAKGRVHEVLGESMNIFALVTAAHVSGPIIWAGLYRDLAVLAPTGVQRFLDPARIVMTQGVTRSDVLWAGEHALRTPGIALVVIEIERGPDLKESRRLQLAAEESGAIGLVLISGRAQTSAAETRWRCEAIQRSEPAWLWDCQKHRKGDVGEWQVSWLGGEYGPDLIHMATATAA